MTLAYDDVAELRSRHPAWILLRADSSPLILNFLGRVFVDRNAGQMPASELSRELDEELYALNQRLGEGTYPKAAAAYLDDWAAPERGWLRKFYPQGSSDEPHYDLTPAVEKALLWVGDLRTREFVGTESRLNTVFELLRQMVFGADEDPERRLADLRRRRAELDNEIAKTERGEFTTLDSVSQRDRFQQFVRTARELLADFREVEDNFRRLDRDLREQIAAWSGSKGALLDDVVGQRSNIADSDQGRSFQAFHDFLLSHQRQRELSELLARLREIVDVTETDERLMRVHFDWLDAAERTQSTVRLLSDQLRRFLDDKVWLENKRIVELLHGIESKALRIRDIAAPPITTELAASAVTVVLPMERPLFRPARPTVLEPASMERGEDGLDTSSLLDQQSVDRDELARRVRSTLGGRNNVGLSEVVEGQPLEQGLAELIGYLSLAEPGLTVFFEEGRTEEIGWLSDDGDRVAELPRVIFGRDRQAPS